MRHSTPLKNGILSNQVVLMPIIAAGTMGYKGTNATRAVHMALDAGVQHIHTAYDYFNLKPIADALKQTPRSQVFVSSMTSPCIHPVAPPMRNVTQPEACYDITYSEAETVLRQLDLDYLDLLMLHGPSEPFSHDGPCSPLACQQNRAQWFAYQRLLAEKKVRAIGVSNFCQSCIRCLVEEPLAGPPGSFRAKMANFWRSTNLSQLLPAVNQIQVHVGQGSADPGPGLISFCRGKGIVVQAYEPLAGGALVKDEFCASIGRKYGKSAAQVALRWVIERVPALAVRAGSAQHTLEDLAILNFSLGRDDLLRLDVRRSPLGESGGRPCWGCTQ